MQLSSVLYNAVLSLCGPSGSCSFTVLNFCSLALQFYLVFCDSCVLCEFVVSGFFGLKTTKTVVQFYAVRFSRLWAICGWSVLDFIQPMRCCFAVQFWSKTTVWFNAVHAYNKNCTCLMTYIVQPYIQYCSYYKGA